MENSQAIKKHKISAEDDLKVSASEVHELNLHNWSRRSAVPLKSSKCEGASVEVELLPFLTSSPEMKIKKDVKLI